ncbi:HNH endonuclease signature motif containing protein [Mycolicibacterium sp. S2-37]|uniref:HNH endonuclease signature motif containing protein n=1 Tax=Mycolicibacterium sp. S2-37 TaxID=2810297 RepID=UPI0035ABED9E
MCERCTMEGHEIHHRRPRGMGGSKDPLTNTAANGVLLCRSCHRWIELNRTAALEFGWLVRQGHDPREVAVNYRGSWARLSVNGVVSHDFTRS